jgi:hypothetical protein
MNKQLVLLLCVVGVLCGPVNVMGETKHCGPNKIPFDPDTEGCCHLPLPLPDGTWKKTPYPQNEPDPCSIVPSGGAYAQVICYNGNKYICVYPDNFPSEWKPPKASQETYEAITNCITQHEEVHMGQDIYCPECTAAAKHPPGQGYMNECIAHQDSRDCAFALPYSEGQDNYLRYITKYLKDNRCPGWYP